jgi:hypothetical protein
LPLRFQNRFWEEHRPPDSTRRAYIHNLVLIWGERSLTFGEGGRAFP